MADILVFPNISFDESDVGPREVLPAAGNRIGVVGRFLRGPRNVFQLVSRQTFPAIYGSTNHNGSLAIQSAIAQGANDFGVIRVMGSGINAGAKVNFVLDQAKVSINEVERLSILATSEIIPTIGKLTQADVLAKNFLKAVHAKFAGINVVLSDVKTVTEKDSAGKDVTFKVVDATISTNSRYAQDLPIRFVPFNNEETEVNTSSGITITAKADSTSGETPATVLSTTNSVVTSNMVRLINGSLLLTFKVDTKTSTSTKLHVMFGGDVITTKGSSPTTKLVQDMIKSIQDRKLGFFAEEDPNAPESLILRAATSDAERGNSFRVSAHRQALSPSTSIDSDFSFTASASILGATANAVTDSLSTICTFGGGVSGPQAGYLTLRKNKFVRRVADGTLAFANSKVTITLSDGEVALNSLEKVLLATKTVEVSSSCQIVAEVNVASNQVKLQILALNRSPAANQVVVGRYDISGAASATNTGTFTPKAAENGDVLRVRAASEGRWAQNLFVSASSSEPGKVQVVAQYMQNATDANYQREEYNIDMLSDSEFDNSPYPVLMSSKDAALVRIEFVGDSESDKNSILQSVVGVSGIGESLSAGAEDGPNPSPKDYVQALRLMADNPVNILIASGQGHPEIRNELIRQAELSDEITGLRIAVLAADPRLNPVSAKSLTEMLNSKHAVMVAGHCTFSERNDIPPLSVPPDGFYAGHLAVTDFHVSPAARTSSPSFKSISAVDLPSPGTQAYNEYTRSRIEAIIPDQVTGSFHCLNGVSLSTDPAWKWISMRRTYNFIRSNAFQRLQFAKSEPNTAKLRGEVTASLNNLLSLMKSLGQINDYQGVKADDENNPPNLVAQGLLRVDIFFTPVYPADFIRVGLHRTVVPVSLTVATAG